MKTFLIYSALTFLISAHALAASSFDCNSEDKSVYAQIEVDSSGQQMNVVSVDGKRLELGKDFTAAEIVLNDRALNFSLLDRTRVKTVLSVETVRKNDISAGLVLEQAGKEVQVAKAIKCEFVP